MMPTQKAEALFDFQPTADVELQLQKGDVVVVRRMSVGEGWWEGELNGRRGLFPSSFVKLLPVVQETTDSAPIPPTPLTPRSSKKAFMETLLAPEPSTLDEIYDNERAAELFVPGSVDVTITAGPKWKGQPPTLTIVVKEPQTESRFSGMKHVTLYEVETKELNSCVSRRYKQFLWLYDRLAENFPCISLPPLPVKQVSGMDSKDLRRRGLEKFLHSVARHPVLACTKILRVFLTDEDSKHDKEWKIGKHLSHFSHNTKLLKTSRKLFHAPVYCTVKYPPYNVPMSQLASIEKFSRFSRLLEMNVNTVHMACGGLNVAQRDMVVSVNLLAKDLKCFAKGMQPTTGAQRRKLQASVTGNQSTSLAANGPSTFYTPNPSELTGVELEEETSGGEEGDAPPSWNWREDEKFNSMVHELQDLAKGMQRTSKIYQTHREAMGTQVMETLQEYSGIINTLPGLVRLHEEAMEFYNFSKDKDSKKEAEEVRQNCETLNNILLAEFDYFSNHLVEDFEAMMLRFLHQQADFHRKLANEWDALHKRYMKRISSRRSDVPIFPLSHSPTPKPPSSASHPHLPTLLHSPTAFRTQSGHLSSSGGSDGAVHSPDYTGTIEPHSHDSQSTLTASQSHPQSKSPGIDPRPDLTASDTHSEPAMGHSYVNLNVDDLTASTDGEEEHKRFRSLSPLEQSIERELEKSHERSLEKSVDDNDYEMVAVGGGEEEDKGKDELQQQYANWQFAQMQEKMLQSRETTSPDSSQKPLLNGGPKSLGHPQGERMGAKPLPSTSAPIPRKPLKPPPLKSRTLADMTALPNSGRSTSPAPPMLITGTSPPTSSQMPLTQTRTLLHKSSSASKLQSVLTAGRSKTPTKEPDHCSTNVVEIDHFLPSQLSKLRSYTASNVFSSPDKKKPILPPAKMGRASVKSQPRFPAVKEIVEVVQERREILESSGEFESSGGSGSGESSKSTRSFKGSTTLPRTVHAGKTKEASAASSGVGVVVSKPAHKPPGQSSPTSELMRKLSQRRQKLEQQLGTSSKHTSVSSTGLDGSSRCTSTSSTQSEFVCSYSTKRVHDESPLNSMEESAEPSLREKDGREDENLAKYGIEEDVEGGSYVI